MHDLASLLPKYDVAGPRYTSYPTVPCWETSPTEDQWVSHLGAALDRAQRHGFGAALYVHIPFCRSLCTYCGCNTRITTKPVGEPYVQTLVREWRILRERLGQRALPIAELHMGGGTPTFLTEGELATLTDGLLSEGVMAEAELSLEADPRVTTKEQLATLRARGFNRLSLGVQDFDPKVQVAIHRVQSVAQVAAVTDAARDLGYKSVGYDLVYGLPHQTLPSIEATIASVMALSPDRIAFYGYAHVPWVKKAQRGFTEEDLPTPPERRALYERGRDMLVAAGYREIGMDHFARPGDALAVAQDEGTLHRNFMGYTPRRVEPLIGLGVSSIGDAGTAFAQNDKDVDGYVAKVESGHLPIIRGHLLDAEDLVIRHHVLSLMTRFETHWEEGGTAYTPFLATVGERLAPMIADGLVELAPGSCRVTPLGQAFVRNVCMAFDARLVRREPTTSPTFSRTV